MAAPGFSSESPVTDRERPSNGLTTGAVLLWLVLLTAILVTPYALHSAAPGEDLTRYTVRLAVLYYGLAAAVMLRLSPAGWAAASAPGRLARWCWTLGWAAYVVHVGMAFHHYHHWSHAAAVEHTREASGVGAGIYASHLFTVAWTADVAFWWLRPRQYAARPTWVGRVLHGFMVLMIFNATVVFGKGFIRWAGAALLAILAAPWAGLRIDGRNATLSR